MISVLVPTLNEERNLADCLASVAFSDDVVVFDSFSTDGTRDIARAAGARFVQRRFDNYALHRNAALGDVPFHCPWVLMLDADERVPAGLADELQCAARDACASQTMFRMRRKDIFQGRWLRRSSGYPTWFGRLVRPESVHVGRAVNEEYLTDGQIGHLKGHLEHYPFNNGMARWIERHNQYSSMEAEIVHRENSNALRYRELLTNDPVARRRALKRLMYRLPARPALVAGYLYILRGGFLDGTAGLTYARLRYTYERLIDLKVIELKRRSASGTS